MKEQDLIVQRNRPGTGIANTVVWRTREAKGIAGIKSGMPALGDVMSGEDIWDVLACIRSTGRSAYGKSRPKEPGARAMTDPRSTCHRNLRSPESCHGEHEDREAPARRPGATETGDILIMQDSKERHS